MKRRYLLQSGSLLLALFALDHVHYERLEGLNQIHTPLIRHCRHRERERGTHLLNTVSCLSTDLRILHLIANSRLDTQKSVQPIHQWTQYTSGHSTPVDTVHQWTQYTSGHSTPVDTVHKWTQYTSGRSTPVDTVHQWTQYTSTLV